MCISFLKSNGGILDFQEIGGTQIDRIGELLISH